MPNHIGKGGRAGQTSKGYGNRGYIDHIRLVEGLGMIDPSTRVHP